MSKEELEKIPNHIENNSNETEAKKNLLKKKTSDAFERGIFGAPTFYISNKIFWGQDRLIFAILEASK